MPINIELSSEAEALAVRSAAGIRLTEYVQKIILAHHMPRTMEELIARVTVLPGETNGLEEVIGKWPGNETDEEVEAALAELS